jgi:hypothetical protein
MTMKAKFLRITMIVVASTFLLAAPALAYLDPGTMTLILNTIAAAFFGAIYMVKLRWHQLKAFFKGKRGEADEPSEAEPIEK